MQPEDYVGFVPRACAWTLDKLLFFALTALMAKLWPVEGLDWHAVHACGLETACLETHWPQLADAFARWLLPAVATVFFLTRLRATPGKLVLRAEVVDARTGETLSARKAWIRVLGSVLSYMTLGVGHLMVIFDRRKQALHDKCAGSVVIRARRRDKKNPGQN